MHSFFSFVIPLPLPRRHLQPGQQGGCEFVDVEVELTCSTLRFLLGFNDKCFDFVDDDDDDDPAVVANKTGCRPSVRHCPQEFNFIASLAALGGVGVPLFFFAS